MNQISVFVAVSGGSIYVHPFVGIITSDSSFRLQAIRTQSADGMFSERAVVLQGTFQIGVYVLFCHIQVIYLQGAVVSIHFRIRFYLVCDYISDRRIDLILELLVSFFLVNGIVIIRYGGFQT